MGDATRRRLAIGLEVIKYRMLGKNYNNLLTDVGMNPSWMLENRSGEDRSTETLLNREETFLFQSKPQNELKD